jgi:hypothetical protein
MSRLNDAPPCIDHRRQKNRLGHKKSKPESWHRNESISAAVASVSLVNQEVSLARILVRASLHGWRSAFGSAFTKYFGAIMTSWYTSRGVRACERDSISPGPPNKEPLSDRPLGWDTNHGWYIKTRLTFIFSGCALVSPYVSASLPSGIFDGLVFVHLTDLTRYEPLSDATRILRTSARATFLPIVSSKRNPTSCFLMQLLFVRCFSY